MAYSLHAQRLAGGGQHRCITFATVSAGWSGLGKEVVTRLLVQMLCLGWRGRLLAMLRPFNRIIALYFLAVVP